MLTPCTCGEPHPHVVASRRTADGVGVELYSDGAVTGRLGVALRAVPVARPRTPEALSVALRAGWTLIGEVELHDLDEVSALYDRCRRAAKKGTRALANVKSSTAISSTDVADARLRAMTLVLDRLGWHCLQADFNAPVAKARLVLKHDSGRVVTFDVDHGRVSLTREQEEWRTDVVGRRGDRFPARRLGTRLIGRTRYTSAQDGVQALASYVSDNGTGWALIDSTLARLLVGAAVRTEAAEATADKTQRQP